MDLYSSWIISFIASQYAINCKIRFLWKVVLRAPMLNNSYANGYIIYGIWLWFNATDIDPLWKVEKAASCTSPLKKSHGAPIWIGNPAAIGIEDIEEPEFGERVYPKKDDICCFWACGVSAASALVHAKLPLAATHAPGCMFVCDKPMKQKANTDLVLVEINSEKKNYSLCLRQVSFKMVAK